MGSNSSAGNITQTGLSDLFLLCSKNVFGVFYVLLFLLGMTGNGLLFWILFRGLRRKSSSHTSRLTEPLFLNIVILDLLFLLYNAPVMFGNILFRDWRLGRLLCITNHSFSLWVSFAAFYSMLAIALLRYTAILHPMRVIPISQKQIAVTCGLIWVTCLIFSIPLWINYEIIHVEGQTYCVNQMAWKEINIYLQLLGGVGFLPPTLLMIFCYLRIICALKVRRVLSMHTVSSLQVNWHASVMALVTMVTLVVMWLPYWLVIFFIKYDELLATVPMYLAYHLTSLLAFANRSINPMICFCLSFQFQAKLRNLFRRVGKEIHQVGPIHLGKIEVLGSM